MGGQVKGLTPLSLSLLGPPSLPLGGGEVSRLQVPLRVLVPPCAFLFLQGNSGRVGQSNPPGLDAPSWRDLTAGGGGPFPPLQPPVPSVFPPGLFLDLSPGLGLPARLLLTWGLYLFFLLTPLLSQTPGLLPSKILL